jgi:uncharacterized membrane protein
MNRFFLHMRTLTLNALLLLPGLLVSAHVSIAQSGVTLYTPYTKISVPPGQSIDYTIDVINNSSVVKKVSLSLAGMPKGWTYDLKSGGWTIGELSVLPKERKNLALRVDVPLKVDKGSYRFNMVGEGLTSLPLTVVVSEQGTFKTELTTKQPNMEGNANATFTFNADLKNRTTDMQLYALRANVPAGWNVAFKTGGRQITSVQVGPNATENLTVEIDPPDAIAAGSYRIPVSAMTGATAANIEFEVVIKGSYSLELTTPTGLMSTGINAGDEKRIELVVRNTGSAELKNIKLNYTAPTNWDVLFDPKQVDKLEPGKTAQVYATIRADKKAIPGDYVANLEAKAPEASSKASFRVSVRTSVLYGWMGMLIIAGVLGTVYFQFRKYGRR